MVEFVKASSELRKQGDESLEWLDTGDLKAKSPVDIPKSKESIGKIPLSYSEANIIVKSRSPKSVRSRKSTKTMENFLQLFRQFKSLWNPNEGLLISYNKIMDSFDNPHIFSLYTKKFSKKVKIFLKSTLLVHFASFLLSCVFTMVREFNRFSFCFFPTVCNCTQKDWLRSSYIFILLVVRFFVPICTMTYSLFHIKELNKGRIFKGIYFFFQYLAFFGLMNLFEEKDNLPIQIIFATGWVVHFLLTFCFFFFLKITFKNYLMKLYLPH